MHNNPHHHQQIFRQCASAAALANGTKAARQLLKTEGITVAKPNKLQQGDRIAYAAKFLRNTGQFTGPSGARRGTFVGYWNSDPQFARVHWDDEAAIIASGKGQYAEADYCEYVKAHGSLVHANNIAKVGSPRFALNDL